MNPPRILVVDDERFNLEIISEFLDHAGYTLMLAESGEQAWRTLDASHAQFDAIILDRMMPGMGGIELLRRLKADPRFAPVPVIMQTAAAAPDQVREGLQAGAYYYLTKPFAPEALATIVRSALADGSERRQLAARLESQVRVMRLAVRGEFRFRTLEEARDLAALMAQLCPDPDVVVVGLSELLANAVEHGNLGICYAEKSRLKREDAWEAEVERRLARPENARKHAGLSFACEAGEIAFTIRDCGPGFDWSRYLDLDPARAYDPNGRGIALACHLSFSRVAYQGSGNTVCACVSLTSEPAVSPAPEAQTMD